MTAPEASARLTMRGMRKRFGATVALDVVDLAIAPGEVHALIGENGAGKSTLMKVLSGALAPDAGEMWLDGARFRPTDPLAARQAGIAMIYQELNLAPDLTVEENLVLGQEPSCWGWVRRHERRERAQAALRALQSEDLPLDARVRDLPIAAQQRVEIARACFQAEAATTPLRVLVMDEPTSSLGREEVETLFAVIRRLRDHGVAVVYISHFLEECRDIATRFTVLRDGCSVATGALAETDEESLVRAMVGREVDDFFPRVPHTIGEPVLNARGLQGTVRPAGVDLTLRAGEICGLAGLVGAGNTEVARVLFGLDRVVGGEVEVHGTRVALVRPDRLLAAGVGFVSENRKDEGLLLGRDLADNLTLTQLRPYVRGGLLAGRRQAAAAQSWLDRLQVRYRSPRQPVRELSGGNQQKIAFARLLHHEADVLLLNEPTRGIDVVSKAAIYRLIGELAAQGKSILLVSSYLPELLGLCDTIGVMRRGRLVASRPTHAWDAETLLATAVGGSDANNTEISEDA